MFEGITCWIFMKNLFNWKPFHCTPSITCEGNWSVKLSVFNHIIILFTVHGRDMSMEHSANHSLQKKGKYFTLLKMATVHSNFYFYSLVGTKRENGGQPCCLQAFLKEFLHINPLMNKLKNRSAHNQNSHRKKNVCAVQYTSLWSYLPCLDKGQC